MPDHVHLLLEIAPRYGVRKLVKLIKGATHMLCAKSFLRSNPGYPRCGLTAISFQQSVPLYQPLAKQYIENQKNK